MNIHDIHFPKNLGEYMSDKIASVVGSWAFLIIQSIILFGWIFVNAVAVIFRWDAYPFILLNLVLSFQAAFTAPIIMMSQNRQSDIDRKKAQLDYEINCKAEFEIEELHTKVDDLQAKVDELLALLKAKS